MPTQPGSSSWLFVPLPPPSLKVFSSYFDSPTLTVVSHERSWPMAGRFVVQSTGLSVLPSPATISSSILNPSEGAYCTTRFHSSTQCSRTRLRPWNSRFSFSVYPSPPPLPAPLSVRVQHFPSTFYRAGINPRCRLRLILQLSLIQRIPWNVIITTVYLELLLSLSAFYTATRGEP